METLLPNQLSATPSKVLPSLLTDTLKENLPKLLSDPLKFADTLKEMMPDLLSDSLKLNLPAILIDNDIAKINKKAKKALNLHMPPILTTSLLLVMKHFNALNKLRVQLHDPTSSMFSVVAEGKKNEQAAPASVPVVDTASKIHPNAVMIEERRCHQNCDSVTVADKKNPLEDSAS
ncbi:hypothetical protein Tco_0276919 [Tanacetum coccineum]